MLLYPTDRPFMRIVSGSWEATRFATRAEYRDDFNTYVYLDADGTTLAELRFTPHPGPAAAAFGRAY